MSADGTLEPIGMHRGAVGGDSLSLPARMGLLLRHAGRLLRDVFGFTLLNGVWWFLPFVLLVLLLALAATATQHVVPYAVYTLF